MYNKLYMVLGIVTTTILVATFVLHKTIVPSTWSKANDAFIKDLHPIIQAPTAKLINRLERKHNIRLKINSGYRDFTEQAAQNPNLAAAPGLSMHNYGLAVDFAVSEWPGKLTIIVNEAKALGFLWGGDWSTNKENWHFYKDFGYKSSDFLTAYNAGKFAKYPPIKLLA